MTIQEEEFEHRDDPPVLAKVVNCGLDERLTILEHQLAEAGDQLWWCGELAKFLFVFIPAVGAVITWCLVAIAVKLFFL